MGNIVVSADYFKELVEKATVYDVICGLYANGKSFAVDEVIKAVKGGRDDGRSSDCKES